MWVRIDEIAFATAQTDDVIDHVRNTAASKHDGEGFRGFRLLVDRISGRALDVSYWETEAAATQGGDEASGAGMMHTVRSNVYELCIDSV
jgi:heme-degrading monooxygenase HmoA